MIKGAAAGLAIMALSATLAQAQGPGTTITFQGEGLITAATSACAGTTSVGDSYKVIYRFKYGSSDPADAMAIYGKRAAFQLVSTASSGSLLGLTTTADALLDAYAGLTTGVAGSSNLNIASAGGLPSGLAVNLKAVGTIDNFFLTQGCQVTFHGLLVVRPAGT